MGELADAMGDLIRIMSGEKYRRYKLRSLTVAWIMTAREMLRLRKWLKQGKCVRGKVVSWQDFDNTFIVEASVLANWPPERSHPLDYPGKRGVR